MKHQVVFNLSFFHLTESTLQLIDDIVIHNRVTHTKKMNSIFDLLCSSLHNNSSKLDNLMSIIRTVDRWCFSTSHKRHKLTTHSPSVQCLCGCAFLCASLRFLPLDISITSFQCSKALSSFIGSEEQPSYRMFIFKDDGIVRSFPVLGDPVGLQCIDLIVQPYVRDHIRGRPAPEYQGTDHHHDQCT